MNKITTKYFGEVELSVDHSGIWANFDAAYQGQEIIVSFSDYGIYRDKVKVCWEIIDKYAELNEIAKKAIIEHFPEKNGAVNYYFKYHFKDDMLDEDELIEIFGVKDFKKMDVTAAVEKMEYPDLLFHIAGGGKITCSAGYMVSKKYSGEMLLVIMDEGLNVTGFLQES